MNTSPAFSYHLLVNSPYGLLPLDSTREHLPLPAGPESLPTGLSCGPYLRALKDFFSRSSHHSLSSVLSLYMDSTAPLDEIRRVDIISEKHGAVYQVARVRVSLGDRNVSFVVNTAVKPEQKAFLETEYVLLHELHERFGLPWLPRPLLKGEAACTDSEGRPATLSMFVAEWFEGYQEFHLSREKDGDGYLIKVWGDKEGDHFLDAEKTRSLYRRAAAILTSYLDTETLCQVYPWHHAAGDFVVRTDGDDVQVRMVTARDYRCLLPCQPGPEEKIIGIIHFFVNLTLRMRLDRLDGVGSPVWAASDSLDGVVSGFLDSWHLKALADPRLPGPDEVLGLFRSFSPDEWKSLAEVVVQHGMVERDEGRFLEGLTETHALELADVLRSSSRVFCP